MTVPSPLPVEKRFDRASIWQLVLGVFGVTLALLSAAVLTVVVLTSKNVNSQNLPFLFWLLILLILLATPSIIFASRRLSGRYSKSLWVDNKSLVIIAAASLCWVGLLYAGNNAANWNISSTLVAPLTILVIAIPVLLLVTVSLYRLNAGSKQRVWGLITATTFGSTQIILFAELTLFASVLIIGFIWLSGQSEFAPYLNLFSAQKSLSINNLQSLVSEISPLINKPDLYAVILLIFCLFAPLIEEAFKPLAVWFLAGKKLTPVQGFAAGVICGATFGVLESISMVSMASGSAWVPTVVARIGTGLLHTFTAGMSGWALAKTWQDHRYWRISLMYAGAVLLHGLWNLFAILLGASKITLPVQSIFLKDLMGASGWVLLGMTVVMFAGLVWMNSHFRKHSLPPVLPDIPVEISTSTN